MLFTNKMRAIIESLLFISNEPLSIKALAEIVGLEACDVLELVLEIKENLDQEIHGMTVLEVAGGYILATKAEYKPYIEKLYKPQLSTLSSAALETLAIIAYKQPITRGDIELLRGVKVEKIIQTLLSKGLIEEQGRKDSPGRPIIYGTTKQFLQYFGINDLSDLPKSELQEVPPEASAEETLE